MSSLSLRPVQPTLSSVSRVVTHDVPVDVIPRKLWHEFKEPSMPDFDVSEEHVVQMLQTKTRSGDFFFFFTSNEFPCVSLQVSIYLPPLKTMKNVVDRMKNLSNFLVRSHSFTLFLLRA